MFNINSLATFEKILKRPNVVVDFWLPNCVPCKISSPAFGELDNEIDITFAKVQANTNSKLLSKYNVNEFPTFIYFRNGVEVARLVGTSHYTRLKGFINDNFIIEGSQPRPRGLSRPLGVADFTLALKATSRQVTIDYTAPDTNACTVEVSESPSYSILVNDVNPVLFSGSDTDTRSDATGSGTTTRSFVAGTIPTPNGVINNLASDGKRYGRALQPNTVHYIRVTCGSHTGESSISTKNIPLGGTRADEPPVAGAGVYAFPTIDNASRTQTIIDPATGILLRKASWPGEDSGGSGVTTLASGAPWPFAQTTINDSTGTPGYLFAMPTNGGSSRLYFVTQATSRFLGTLVAISGGGMSGIGTTYLSVGSGSVFGSDPTQLFGFAQDSSGNYHVIKCQLPASGNSYYDAPVADGTSVSCTWTDMTPNPNNLDALMLTFSNLSDTSYDHTKFNPGAQPHTQGNYLIFNAPRGYQDSYGWVGVVDISGSTATVVGMLPVWKRGGASMAKTLRWAGIHSSHSVLGSNSSETQWASFTTKTMYEAGVGRRFVTHLSGAMNNTQMTITFTSNTPACTTNSETLYDIVAGDGIWVDAEAMILGSLVSGTTWNIAQRGISGGTIAVSHVDNSEVLMDSRGTHEPNDWGQYSPVWWNFIADPHGTDITETYLIPYLNSNVGAYGGHEGYANNRGISEEGWSGFIGPAATENTPFSISDSPTFAGASKSASGNAWQKHPTPPQQSHANSIQSKVWGSDFMGHDADIETEPTSLTNVTGTLYKFTNTNYTLNRKKLTMLAIMGSHPLLDISSTATGDVISGSSGDNYKYCVANAPNECRNGSSIGDIYVNAPDLTSQKTYTADASTDIITCSNHGFLNGGQLRLGTTGSYPSPLGGGITYYVRDVTTNTFKLAATSGGAAIDITTNGTGTNFIAASTCQHGNILYDDTTSICIGHIPAFGSTAMQIGIVEATSIGKYNRSLTSGLMPLKTVTIGEDSHAMPDGNWLNFLGYDGVAYTHWLARVPPWPGFDGINRNDFIQIPISISTLGGSDNAIIEFGYNPNFYCTSRNEICVSAQSNNPYFFASEVYTGFSLPATAHIPAIPNYVVYYRIKWRNGSSVVQTSPTYVIAEDSAPLGASTGVAACKWNTSPVCQ